MKTNTALTLYNTFYDALEGINKWQRTNFSAVMWEDRKATNVLATGGEIAADQARIFIPKYAGYLDPVSWQALSDKSGNWTLQEGDFVIKGNVSSEISASLTPSELKAQQHGFLKITSVDNQDMGSAGMQHWQVGAK